MRGWLLDTNVVSELRKPSPNAKVIDFIEIQPGATLFVTEVTLAEIRYGIEQLGDAARRADLHRWLERDLRPVFAGRVLAITEEVIVRWKTFVVEGRKTRPHIQSTGFVYCVHCSLAGPCRRQQGRR